MSKTRLTTKTRNYGLPSFLNENLGVGIGFDRWMNMLDDGPFESTNRSYPPYNIVRLSDDSFRIEVALAGFASEDVKVLKDGNRLKISGEKPDVISDDSQDGDLVQVPEYIYQGIGSRPFSREFVLAEHVEVESARFNNGVLEVILNREVPEAMRPKTIEIQS